MALLTNLGGLLYTLRTICNGMVNWLSDFGVDNSLMRKLYSTEKERSEEESLIDSYNTNFRTAKAGLGTELKKNLDLREAWNYSWQEYWTSQKICCSCCRRTNNTRDKLFLKGR